MPDSLPPVAIRVARPYATEDELLDRELDTLTRTSVTLLGAQPRPHGVVLRFELVLSTGQVLMRGEGRVVGYKSNALDGLGGLTLRFTRLDTRSKAVVDRAAALRDRRRPSTSAPPAEGMPIPSFPPLAPGEGEIEPPQVVETMSLAPPIPISVAPPGPISSLPPDDRPALLPSLAPLASMPPEPLPPPPPPVLDGGRDALLERLRVRSKTLGHDALQKLLERRRS